MAEHRGRTIATLGDMIAAGYTIGGFCRGCERLRDVDLATLVERLGRDYAPSTHGGRIPLRCSGCGSRNVGITISPHRRR